MRFSRSQKRPFQLVPLLNPSVEEFRRLRGLDGILAFDPPGELLPLLRRSQRPWIEMITERSEGTCPRVVPDDVQAGRLAADHLIQRGHRRLAFIGPNMSFSRVRLESFQDVGKGAGVQISEKLLSRHALESERRKNEEIDRFLSALELPAGLMGGDDGWALDVMEIALRKGIQVPEQLSLIGVNNNVAECETAQIPLSSIPIQRRRIGYESARMLLKMVAGRSVPDVLALESPGVVMRESTAGLETTDPRLAQAVAFIRENAVENIGVDDVAAAVPLSRSALEKCFRRELRRSIGQYLRQIRIETACGLLRDTDLPLAEVADRSGFSYLSYFCRAFRKHTGQTPSEFRDNHHLLI